MLEQTFKVILIGGQGNLDKIGVGKTSIIQRFTKQQFKENYDVTLGLDFSSKKIQIQNNLINLQIWDTAGQEIFKSIVRTFYQNAEAVMLVYDVSNLDSFLQLQTWVDEINKYCPVDCLKILVGNKIDSINPEVSLKQQISFIDQNDIQIYYETSAKEGDQIDKVQLQYQLFYETSRKLLVKYIENQLKQPSFNLKEKKKKNNCC